MFEHFKQADCTVGDVPIRFLHGGGGPPLLLLHGYPQTHVVWHKTAAELARHFTVVLPDLRGYGDSGKPPGLPDHSNYSKRAMAYDQMALMRHLGHERFLVMGHDRGGRVGHRLALDHPRKVRRLVVLDIAPTLAMYEHTGMTFAMQYFHWFFLIRPAPFPETLINGHPEVYLRQALAGREAGMAPFTPQAYSEYLRCMRDPATVHGMCEDYRASASIDLEHDRNDRARDKRVECKLLALWGANGVIAQCFDPLAEWRKVALDVDGKALDCAHYMPEEAPEQVLAAALPFLLD